MTYAGLQTEMSMLKGIEICLISRLHYEIYEYETEFSKLCPVSIMITISCYLFDRNSLRMKFE